MQVALGLGCCAGLMLDRQQFVIRTKVLALTRFVVSVSRNASCYGCIALPVANQLPSCRVTGAAASTASGCGGAVGGAVGGYAMAARI